MWRGERTQVAIATMLGVDQGLYSKWERGVRRPGRRPAMKIALMTSGLVSMESWDVFLQKDSEAKAV